MTGIGIAGCDGCGCDLCCKQVWRSTYNCYLNVWNTPTLFSDDEDQPCLSDVDWHIPSGQCYAETTIYTIGSCTEGPPAPP